MGVLILGMALSFFNALMNSSSPQGSFSMLNAVQLILLLPLIGAHLPFDVLAFIVGMDFAFLNVDVFSFNKSEVSHKLLSYFEFEQDNSYLYLIGLEYGDSASNVIDTLDNFIILPVIHLIVAIIY